MASHCTCEKCPNSLLWSAWPYIVWPFPYSLHHLHFTSSQSPCPFCSLNTPNSLLPSSALSPPISSVLGCYSFWALHGWLLFIIQISVEWSSLKRDFSWTPQSKEIITSNSPLCAFYCLLFCCLLICFSSLFSCDKLSFRKAGTLVLFTAVVPGPWGHARDTPGMGCLLSEWMNELSKNTLFYTLPPASSRTIS